ncbi:sensor histidine kinase [Paractinoplanes rishiriensis]|uniref:histidine kinase n=1 Tax=Paractinoplanes rishiriensis TaxID=1050105 RepID=A0A919MUX1_9ACTN|nr:HAMP domain-containing sensor histidine kinase [Actinoplanes rishiriensis]GIE93020.1 two-component sensor histidine kinase [Actinoplanes rishiriensis]
MTRRLLFTYLSLALVVLAGLALPLGYVYQRSEQQRAFAQLEHDAEVLAAFMDTALSRGNPGQVVLLAHESAHRWGGEVDVVDAAGRPMAATRPEGATPLPAGDLHAVLAGQVQISSGMTEVAGVPMMSVAVPLHPGNRAQGALRVSVPTAAMNARIHQFWYVLAIVAVSVLACGALVAVGLARWIGRPVRLLERATRNLADGAAAPAAPAVTGPPELRRLAATLDATATRLQDLIAAQRSFVGHASHQLKTPLAALRLRLENLEPDVAAGGEANLRAALVETDRLATLVDTLLAMTRAEHTSQPSEPVAVADAAGERAAVWRPVAEDRGVTLTVRGPDDLWVRAIPGALDQILDNLLSNALNIAPAGSTIAVTWRVVAGLVEVHVVDAGAGLTDDQRDQALQPFWRAPGAAKGGTGLGLALVRKLAEASGGRVRLDAAEPTGVDAVVVLPGIG